MNNKLFARIAAAAVGVSMLATVAFAADPTLVDNTLSFKVGTEGADITISEEAQITMMAYVVGADVATTDAIPAYSDQEIIALDQVEGSTGFGDVLVEATKLEDAKKIAVLLGGSDGTVEKYLIALEGEGEDAKVTIMNGATAIDVPVVGGKATLPETATFDKTSPAGYTFKLYSWVAVDAAGAETAEYLAGAEVNAAELEGVTLYAKFATTELRGDFNGNGSIDATDMNPIQFKVKGLLPAMQKNVGLAIYEGSTILKGDFNGNGSIDATDMNPLQFKVKGLLPAMQKDVDKPYYVVNK